MYTSLTLHVAAVIRAGLATVAAALWTGGDSELFHFLTYSIGVLQNQALALNREQINSF